MSDRQWYCSDSVGKFCRVWCYTLNGWGFKCGNISSNSIRDSSCIVELNDNVSIRTNIFNISLLDDHSEFDVLGPVISGEFCIVPGNIFQFEYSPFNADFFIGVTLGPKENSNHSIVFPFNPSLPEVEIDSQIIERFFWVTVFEKSQKLLLRPGQVFSGGIPHPLSIVTCSEVGIFHEERRKALQVDLIKLFVKEPHSLTTWCNKVNEWMKEITNKLRSSTETLNRLRPSRTALDEYPEILLLGNYFDIQPLKLDFSLKHPSWLQKSKKSIILKNKMKKSEDEDDIKVENHNILPTKLSSHLVCEDIDVDNVKNFTRRLTNANLMAQIGVDARYQNFSMNGISVYVCNHHLTESDEALSLSDAFNDDVHMSNNTFHLHDHKLDDNVEPCQKNKTLELSEIIQMLQSDSDDVTLSLSENSKDRKQTDNVVKKEIVTTGENSSLNQFVTSSGAQVNLPSAFSISLPEKTLDVVEIKKQIHHQKQEQEQQYSANKNLLANSSPFLRDLLIDAACLQSAANDRTQSHIKLWALAAKAPVPASSKFVPSSCVSSPVDIYDQSATPSAHTPSETADNFVVRKLLLPPVKRALGVSPPHTLGEFIDSVKLSASSNFKRASRRSSGFLAMPSFTASTALTSASGHAGSSAVSSNTPSDLWDSTVEDVMMITESALKDDMYSLERPLVTSSSRMHLTNRLCSATFSPQTSLGAYPSGTAASTAKVRSRPFSSSANLGDTSANLTPAAVSPYQHLDMKDESRGMTSAEQSLRNSRRSKVLAMVTTNAANSKTNLRAAGFGSHGGTPRQQESRALRVLRRRVAIGQVSEDSFRALVESTQREEEVGDTGALHDAMESSDEDREGLWSDGDEVRPSKTARIMQHAEGGGSSRAEDSMSHLEDETAESIRTTSPSARGRGLPRFGPGSRGGRTQIRNRKWSSASRTTVLPQVLDALRKRDDTIVRAYVAALKAGADESQAFVAAYAVTGIPVWEVRKVIVERKAEHQQQMNAIALLLLQQQQQQQQQTSSSTDPAASTQQQQAGDDGSLLSLPNVDSAAAATQQIAGSQLIASGSASSGGGSIPNSPSLALKFLQQQRQNVLTNLKLYQHIAASKATSSALTSTPAGIETALSQQQQQPPIQPFEAKTTEGATATSSLSAPAASTQRPLSSLPIQQQQQQLAVSALQQAIANQQLAAIAASKSSSPQQQQQLAFVLQQQLMLRALQQQQQQPQFQALRSAIRSTGDGLSVGALPSTNETPLTVEGALHDINTSATTTTTIPIPSPSTSNAISKVNPSLHSPHQLSEASHQQPTSSVLPSTPGTTQQLVSKVASPPHPAPIPAAVALQIHHQRALMVLQQQQQQQQRYLQAQQQQHHHHHAVASAPAAPISTTPSLSGPQVDKITPIAAGGDMAVDVASPSHSHAAASGSESRPNSNPTVPAVGLMALTLQQQQQQQQQHALTALALAAAKQQRTLGVGALGHSASGGAVLNPQQLAFQRQLLIFQHQQMQQHQLLQMQQQQQQNFQAQQQQLHQQQQPPHHPPGAPSQQPPHTNH